MIDLSTLAPLEPTVLFFAKILIVFTLGIYTIFAFVVVRQVNLMTKTLQLGLETSLRVFAYLHFFAAVFLMLFSVFLL